MKYKYYLVVSVLLLGFTNLANAASGSGIIPFWYSYDNGNGNKSYFFLSISNITDSTINVSVRFYNKDGTVLNESSSSGTSGDIVARFNYSNYNEPSTGDSVEFDLGGRDTTEIQIKELSTEKGGWAVIEWSSTSDIPIALVAHARSEFRYVNTNRYNGAFSIPINNGRAF